MTAWMRERNSNQPGASYALNLPTWRGDLESTVPAPIGERRLPAENDGDRKARDDARAVKYRAQALEVQDNQHQDQKKQQLALARSQRAASETAWGLVPKLVLEGHSCRSCPQCEIHDQRVGLPRLAGPDLRQMWEGFFDWHDDEVQFIGERVDWRTGVTIRCIVWRFGSHRAQAVAAMHYMRSYFPDIWVFYATDPCDVQVQRP
ncbi:hypothetical protein FJTKL_15329 [Diaporthe vaccinii]|uniref:Uncharacterized protein n=1 Tax=Diaporthe vaccinii TaxID=105482 RepID=A0ABR4E5A4_9PEZI